MADNQPGKPSARWRKFVNDRPIASLILTGAIATQLGTYFGYVFPAVGLPTLPWPMYNGALAQGIKGPVWGDYFAADYSITGHGATGLFFTGMALHFVNGIVFAILFGIIAFQAPELTTAVGTIIVAFYIATWSIVTGVMRISMAIRLRKEIEGEWLLGFSGAVSILLGLVVLVRPQVGALGLLYVVAAAAIILGMTLIAFAIKVRMFAVRIRQTVQSIREQ